MEKFLGQISINTQAKTLSFNLTHQIPSTTFPSPISKKLFPLRSAIYAKK